MGNNCCRAKSSRKNMISKKKGQYVISVIPPSNKSETDYCQMAEK